MRPGPEPSGPSGPRTLKGSIIAKNDHWKPKSARMCVFGSANDFKPPSSVLGAIKVHPFKTQKKGSEGEISGFLGPTWSKYFSTMGALWSH